MKGRPPKPTEAHIIEGTYRADRHGDMPVMVNGTPDLAEFEKPPKGLSRDGRSWWRDNVVPALRNGVLDRADMSIATLAAQQWDRIAKCERVIAQDGFFAEGSMGQLKEHPAVKMQRESTALYLRLAEQLGMGAVNRARLGLAHLTGAALMNDLEKTLAGEGEVVAEYSDPVEVGLPGG